MRGSVEEATAEESAADLAARSAAARADVDPGDWVLCRIRPVHVEFWQGSPDRRHARILFDRVGDAWTRSGAGGEGETPPA